MSRDVRAFLAVTVSSDAKDVLSNISDELSSSELQGLKLADPAQIHLTLKFLGNVGMNDIKRITEATSSIATAYQPFLLRLQGVGVFPNKKRANVLWVGLSGDLLLLKQLTGDLNAELASLGMDAEKHFSPHLTIARIAKNIPAIDRQRVVDRLFSITPDPAPLPVSSINLMSSTLQRSGARHKRISVIQLG